MQKVKLETKWAVIFILMTLVWMLGEKLVGLHDEHIEQHMYYTNLIALPAIFIYYLALKEKKQKDYQGKMSYKLGFITGLLISLIVAFLSPLSQYITTTYITPQYFSTIIEYSVESGQMDSRAAAEAYFNLENYIVQSVIGALLMGLITSALVALLVRTKPKD